jgi:hypothetical protein
VTGVVTNRERPLGPLGPRGVSARDRRRAVFRPARAAGPAPPRQRQELADGRRRALAPTHDAPGGGLRRRRVARPGLSFVRYLPNDGDRTSRHRTAREDHPSRDPGRGRIRQGDQLRRPEATRTDPDAADRRRTARPQGRRALPGAQDRDAQTPRCATGDDLHRRHRRRNAARHPPCTCPRFALGQADRGAHTRCGAIAGDAGVVGPRRHGHRRHRPRARGQPGVVDRRGRPRRAAGGGARDRL